MKARLSILIYAIQSLTFGDGMSFWNALYTVSQRLNIDWHLNGEGIANCFVLNGFKAQKLFQKMSNLAFNLKFII